MVCYGHGRRERREVWVREAWVSEELATYADFPGLTSVIRVHQVVHDNRSGPERGSVQYGVSSLADLAPDRALALSRGHWEIENRLFYVKDDGFGEDRQVLQHHHSGLVMSLLRGAGLRAIALQMLYKGFRAGQSAENRWVMEIRTTLNGLGVGIRRMSA